MTTSFSQYLLNGCMRCPLGGTLECKVHTWIQHIEALRQIMLGCGLTEEMKWGVPCYTLQGKNVGMVSAFKNFACLSFFKGALLQDDYQLLEKPGPNSQAARLIKFTDVEQITRQQTALEYYIKQAIEVEKAGLKVAFKKELEPMPPELEQALEDDPVLSDAFNALTPGKQRSYILYISQPKGQPARTSRLHQCIPKILNGEGLHDKYKGRK
ncbi:MAG TPA: YdeI/OmpD-associated family protein [Phnomibacter sp.]|nr:YdeI/OmpD-associated family protein [Phnomibacter sp.]